METPLNDPEFAARFWSCVDPDTHEWSCYCDGDVCGIFTTAGPAGERVKFLSHRVAWALANNRQPSGVIRNGCDTPAGCDARCLSDGTQRENMADRDDPACAGLVAAVSARVLKAKLRLQLPMFVGASVAFVA